MEKYGKEFALEAIENRDSKVSERVLKKLRVEPPEQILVTLYLKEIARTYGISWSPELPPEYATDNENNEDDDDEPSQGHAVRNLEEPLTTEELTRATPPRDLGPKSPVRIAPPSPSTDNLNPRVKLPGPPQQLKPSAKMMTGLKKKKEDTDPGAQGPVTSNTENDLGTVKKHVVEGKIPEVDELAKRFAALKR